MLCTSVFCQPRPQPSRREFVTTNINWSHGSAICPRVQIASPALTINYVPLYLCSSLSPTESPIVTVPVDEVCLTKEQCNDARIKMGFESFYAAD